MMEDCHNTPGVHVHEVPVDYSENERGGLTKSRHPFDVREHQCDMTSSRGMSGVGMSQQALRHLLIFRLVFATKRTSRPIDASPCEQRAERGGFEPPVPCGTLVFKTSPIGHSGTSPSDLTIY